MSIINKVKRNEIVKHAFDSNAFAQMTDETFFDFVAFYSKQTNVDKLEDLRITLNARQLLEDDNDKTVPKKNQTIHYKIQKAQAKIGLYSIMLVYILFVGFFVLFVFTILYGLWFWKKDVVKASICLHLLGLAIGCLCLFFILWVLYNVVILQYKKIMLLI